MNASPVASAIEDLTIQPVPEARRTGSARHLFSVWFGVQIMPLTLVTGVLGPTIFHLDAGWSVLAIIIGNVVGAVFMALHSVQGSKLGVPQMIQARGQFGMYGSLLVIGVVIVMYLGFFASIVVLARDTLLTIFPLLDGGVALVLCAAISLAGVIFGYDLIHRANRILLYLFGVAVVLMAVFLLVHSGAKTGSAGDLGFSGIGFLGMISTAAVWQLAYAPYVSDYSRYLPTKTSAGAAFWFTYLGAVIGAIPMMTVGVFLVTTAGGKGTISDLLNIMPVPLALFVLAMLFLGAIDAAVINLYGPALCVLTFAQTFRPSWSPGARSRNTAAACIAVVATFIALLFADNFLVAYASFISFLICLLIPWSIINLVDYYLIKKGHYDVEAFSDRNKGYGAFNIPAVLTYALGFIVQFPFMANTLYVGPVSAALDGLDLSWIVGSVASLVIYLGLHRLAQRNAVTLAEPASVRPTIERT
jgi:NCS1 family nucleobase:cation symporter-1